MKHADIVNKMSLEQKAAFVSGFDYWHLEEAGVGSAQDHGNGRPSRPA